MRRVTETVGEVDVVGYANGQASLLVPGLKPMTPDQARALAHSLWEGAKLAPALIAEAGGLFDAAMFASTEASK
jgi:hypothetical protein